MVWHVIGGGNVVVNVNVSSEGNGSVLMVIVMLPVC